MVIQGSDHDSDLHVTVNWARINDHNFTIFQYDLPETLSNRSCDFVAWFNHWVGAGWAGGLSNPISPLKRGGEGRGGPLTKGPLLVGGI